MAMILGALVGKCVENIAASVEESATLVLGIKDDLEDLERKLQMFRSVLRDAEMRRIQDKAVDFWLNQLEDVMYDAQDILDDCKFKRPRLLQDLPTSSLASLLPSCIYDVSFRHEIGQKIKKLNDRLEKIVKDKDMFMFTVEQSKPDDIRPSGVNLRQTCSLEEEDIVGGDIQEATNQLAELIIGEEKKKCRVFAIVGMGGIGKTTLAQKLYNDPRIKNNFQQQIWVCISQSFSETDLLREIIRSAGGNSGNAQTKAVLLPMLMDVVMGKRLFLVLDDVWRADVWVDLLRNPLRRGPASCTIVVTTRKVDVATMMGAEFVHTVGVLPVESGWEMLSNRVFINGEEEEIQTFREIGIQIVEKCQCLPRAIKTIAGVLSAKDRTRREWEKVLRSSSWSMSQLPDGVGGALYLSFEEPCTSAQVCVQSTADGMAMILGALVGKSVEKIAASVEESATLVLGVKDDLEDLERKLQLIRSVIRDAERRRFQEKAVDIWLNQLEDVMYDAEDILDHCNFKRPRFLQDQPTSSSALPVRSDSLLSSVSFRHEIGQKIKKFNDRLERIGKDKDMFIFTMELSKPDDISPSGVNLRQTSPLEEEDIVGDNIQEATNMLAELIVGEENQKCRVFAIVGMGGIGKTTLAQKLLKDPKIQSSFEQRLWVCISEPFWETNLLKQIISMLGGYPGDAETKAELLPMLMTVLEEKHLFLVLDNICQADVWVDLLRNPLQRGTASCTIIVTTRYEEVAYRMRATFVHRVQELSIESGWEMLRKRVFMNGEDEKEIKSLQDIGIQIVKKCHGLPLAIKTIAGVLSAKDRTRQEWEKVVRSYAWSMSQLPEELKGALYLSYEDLPFHLKQCFLHLSLFPEDYTYSMSKVIPLWIADGLVETHGNSLEDTAGEYYTELIRRSLLHPVPEFLSDTDPNYVDQPVCKMHDLIRSLALYLSRKNIFCGDVECISTSIASHARHLLIEHKGYSAVLNTDSLTAGSFSERLRTLMLLNGDSTVEIENDLISRLLHLRVLNLNGKGIDYIPDSIGDLIHLRYLNLDDTYVYKLPESLGCLINLQFVSLSNCKSLRDVPDSIGGLIHLRHLNLNGTSVSELPESLGCLINLQFLSLSNCKSLRDVPESIGGLIHLRHLNLNGTSVSELTESLGCLINLQFLSLSNCKSLRGVPESIGGLIHLRHLYLNGTSVSELPESCGSLTNLQFLSLSKCDSLHSVPDFIGNLIHLRFLNLHFTPVSKLPDSFGGLVSLRFLKLHYTGVSELPESLGRLTNLQSLNLCFLKSFHSVPDAIGGLIHLRDLNLSSSHVSKLPESLGCLKNLQSLNLSFCKSFHSVPDAIGSLIQLRDLNLSYSDVSKLPESLGGLTNLLSLNLNFCKSFHSVPDAIGGLIHLRDLNLANSHVSELPDSLGRLTNLWYLSLSSCKSLHTLPQGITRLCNLRHLSMDHTPVRYVPKGIGKLQQLNYLNGLVLGDDDSIAVGGKPQQGCDLEDLRDLSQLRFLDIYRLERASTGMAALRSKPHLKKLCLTFSQQTEECGQQPYTEEEMGKIVKIEEIFNELIPPKCLKSLTLNGFFGRSFPSWMFTCSLPVLNDITLKNFKSCPQVPPLGKLAQLKSITIEGASTVVTIGPEFMGADVREGIHELTSIAFPKLESLSFVDMANWEEWSLGRETEEGAAGHEGRIENLSLMLFPCIQNLYISNCPNLRALPISGLPALKRLTVHHCLALEDVGSQNALKRLKLTDYELECLPEWLIQLLQQRLQDEDSNFQLNLNCNVRLLRKCLLNGPYWRIIQQIPMVDAYGYTSGRRLYMNYTKFPFSYTTNFLL